MYQQDKQNGPLAVGLKSLSPGYAREREFYLQNGKKSGGSLSESFVATALHHNINDRAMKRFVGRGHGDLSLADAMKIAQLYPMPPVQYKNKIERLRHMVHVNGNGQLCDFDDNPILMVEMRFGKYMQYPYAMDKYGNLFMESQMGNKNYVDHNHKTGQYTVKETSAFNHSSFLASADVICAGCMHVGYNPGSRRQEAGYLSSIDNISGHYKPTAENLLNCVRILREQGVITDATRVEVRNADGDTRYWGRDFIRGVNPWPGPEQPPPGFLKAPPIF